MQQIRLLRGEMWVNKGKIPAILGEVFEKTFTPSLIIGAFRKCGIAPFSRNSIDKDLMKSPIEGTVIAELKLDVVSPSQVPADVVPSPPSGSMRSRGRWPRRNWRRTKEDTHTVTTVGLEVYQRSSLCHMALFENASWRAAGEATNRCTNTRRRASAAESRPNPQTPCWCFHDATEKADRETRKAKPAGATATSVATAAHSATDRHDYFACIQGLLVNCRSYASMKLTIPDTFLYPFEPTPSSETTLQGMPEDAIDAQLLSQVTGMETSTMRPVHVLGDGNCCPRSASLFFTGSDDRPTEMRVWDLWESCCCTMTGIWTRVFCARELIELTPPFRLYMRRTRRVTFQGLNHQMPTSETSMREKQCQSSAPVPAAAYGSCTALASVVNRPIRSIYPGRRRLNSVACCTRDNNPAWQTITGT